MTRKIAIVLAAIIVPGGFIALLGGWLVQRLSQTEKGRKVITLARARATTVAAAFRRPVFQLRQAA